MKKFLLLAVILAVLGAAAGAQYARMTQTAQPSPTASAGTATTTTFNIYFANSKLDPEVSCQQVFPVKRTVAKTTAVGTAALNALLAGPTQAEKTSQYSTAIPAGAHLVSLIIADGVANAAFDEALVAGVGGSCRVALIRHQITATLLQFPTVKSVVISIDGRTEDILQP
jgi:spore germination protein GerM